MRLDLCRASDRHKLGLKSLICTKDHAVPKNHTVVRMRINQSSRIYHLFILLLVRIGKDQWSRDSSYPSNRFWTFDMPWCYGKSLYTQSVAQARLADNSSQGDISWDKFWAWNLCDAVLWVIAMVEFFVLWSWVRKDVFQLDFISDCFDAQAWTTMFTLPMWMVHSTFLWHNPTFICQKAPHIPHIVAPASRRFQTCGKDSAWWSQNIKVCKDSVKWDSCWSESSTDNFFAARRFDGKITFDLHSGQSCYRVWLPCSRYSYPMTRKLWTMRTLA